MKKIPGIILILRFILISNLSRGVLPENQRRGPYAVVDELVLDLNNTVVKSHKFAYFFGP